MRKSRLITKRRKNLWKREEKSLRYEAPAIQLVIFGKVGLSRQRQRKKTKVLVKQIEGRVGGH